MDSDEANDDSGPGKRNAPNGKRTRTRVSRACDRCRTKKDKCDGKRPNCSACVALGHVCSYDPSTKKRGLPEGYVRGLEKLWALCMGKIDGLEEAVVELLQHQDEVTTMWNHETVGEELHRSWKESSVLHELEGLLSKLEATANESAGKRKRERDESESEGTLETNFHRTLEYDIQPIATNARPRAWLYGNAADVLHETADAILPLVTNVGGSDSVSCLSALPFPSRMPALLDLYFSHTHCWFPILERHHILRISYSCSSKERRPDSVSSADRATLWALLAYTDRQYAHISTHAQMTGEMDATEMLAIAKKLLPPFGDIAFEIGHVQALLLIALNSIGSQWNYAWVVIGHAVRIAIEINVGKVSTRGKHVLFGCFVMDTLISARLNRRPHMRRKEVEFFGHLEEDGLEEWDPWTNSIGVGSAQGGVRGPAFAISCFNRLVDVCAVLNDIICDTSSDLERQTFCTKQSERLESLFRDPAFSHQGSSSDAAQQQGPPHTTYLFLTYFAAQLALAFHAQTSSEQKPPDSFARNACEILVLLTRHAQSIGLAVLPPFLEYAMRLSLEGAIVAPSHFDHTKGLPTFAVWLRQMSEHVEETKSLWPVFISLSHTLADAERQGRGLFALPTTPATFQIHEMVKISTSRSAPASRLVQPSLNFWETPSSSAAPSSITNQVSQSFDLLMPDLTTPTSSTMTMPAGLTMPATTQTSPSFQGDDVDAIFHDLAHLDTTEWTNNREQGLREFGFADDLTFQAFCNDPDRLVNSATAFDAAGLDDNGGTSFWPPPGFFPEHFDEENTRMEASQILQSLAGNDQYPTLPESVGW